MAEEINIVFACDNNYIQHAAVAMMSIAKNTSPNNVLVFYLLCDNVSDESKERVRATFTKTQVKVNFIDADIAKLENIFVSGTLSRAAYLRLLMAELLPETVNKAIYFDCDLLVLKDIVQLWQVDLAGKPLAAVADYGIMASHKDWRRKQKKLGFQATDMYFNSGVLVVDVAAWRANDYDTKIITLAKNNAYQHHDQDALNVMFYQNWQEIPLKWNVIPPVWNLFAKVLFRSDLRQSAIAARKNIAVLHYAGGYKPWEYKEIDGFNDAYYHYFRQTAFADEPMPQPNKRRKGRSIRRQMMRLKLADFWQKVFA